MFLAGLFPPNSDCPVKKYFKPSGKCIRIEKFEDLEEYEYVSSLDTEDPLSTGMLDFFFQKIVSCVSFTKREFMYLEFAVIFNSFGSTLSRGL
jgi:hypothetical protein